MKISEIKELNNTLFHYEEIKRELYDAKKRLATYDRNIHLGGLMSHQNELTISIWDSQYDGKANAKKFVIELSDESVERILKEDLERVQKKYDDFVKKYNIEDDEKPWGEPDGMI